MPQQETKKRRSMFARKNTRRPPRQAAKGSDGAPAATGRMDLPFLILTILLTVMGLVMLFSASNISCQPMSSMAAMAVF